MKVWVVIPQGTIKLDEVPNLLRVCKIKALAEQYLWDDYERKCMLFASWWKKEYPSFEKYRGEWVIEEMELLE